MPTFNGIPPGQKINFDGILKTKPSVMCPACKSKFKAWLESGGERPVPCTICKDNLKNKMIAGRYPDRTDTKDMAE